MADKDPEQTPAAEKAAKPKLEPAEKPEPTPKEWEERRAALLSKIPSEDKRPKSIYGKLAQLMGLIPPVEKAGRNDFHKYNYAKEGDLVEAVRPLLAEYGIFFWWTILEEERRGRKKSQTDEMSDAETLTVLKIQFQFIDAAGDKTEPQIVYGYGDDPIDKGLYKAMTGAIKYALMKTFLIATGDDPEGDAAADRRGAAHEATGRMEVRRGPQQQRPQSEAPTVSRPQPAPGGRQAAATVPQSRSIGDYLRALNIRTTSKSVELFRELGFEVAGFPENGTVEEKSAAFSAWINGLDSQTMGKLVHDVRKKVEAQEPAADTAPAATAPETEEEAPAPEEAPDMSELEAGSAV
jgi:ERF superfamily